MERPLDSQEIKEEKIIKKVFITVIALFLIFLMLSFIIFNSSAQGSILSFLIGSRLNNYTLHVDKTTKLVFNNESITILNNLYSKNLEREFKVCLEGNKINNTYFITETIQPTTFQQAYDFVIAEPCSSDSLVDLHTHPFKDCIPSEQDSKVFSQFKKRNQDALLAVMCDKNLFLIYK